MPAPPTTPATEQGASARAPDPLLDGLTREQLEAVCHDDGPLIVFAGPGTGKTHTLTARIGWLIRTGRATPHEVLALTFTCSAAEEMRVRLAGPELLGRQAVRGLTAGTFHSVCARILRQHAATFRRTDRYTIYDETDAKALLTRVLSAKSPAVADAIEQCGQVPAAAIYHQISLAKGALLNPQLFEAQSRHPAAALIAAVWLEFERELLASNAFTFGDLIVCSVWLLAELAHLRAYYRQRWRWVLVDEFQDTNHAQMTLIRLLAGTGGSDGGGRLTVVGDDDQALFSFQGARPENLLKFGSAFPRHHKVLLTRNFRSKSRILDFAGALIQHNRAREPKALFAMRGPGGAVQAHGFGDDVGEARWIANRVRDALAHGISPDEIQILHRSRWVSQALQRALAAAGIPHRILGSLGLYERAVVKGALAYLRLLSNPHDQVAFANAIGCPKRGVGEATQLLVCGHARAADVDLLAACADAATLPGIRQQRVREALESFAAAFEQAQAGLKAGRSLAHVAGKLLTMDGGLVPFYQREREQARDTEQHRDADRVIEDLRSVVDAIAAYEHAHGEDATLPGFLELASGLNAIELNGEDRRVTLSSLHRSKGLQAQLVIVHALEEMTLPSWRALQSLDAADLEEERRIAYVGATRAKDWLMLCYSARRNGRPTDGRSRFLAEGGLAPAATTPATAAAAA